MPAELVAVEAKRTFDRFVAAINQHDVDSIREMLPADHLFIDSLETTIEVLSRWKQVGATTFQCAQTTA